jgi:hypothetical protein
MGSGTLPSISDNRCASSAVPMAASAGADEASRCSSSLMRRSSAARSRRSPMSRAAWARTSGSLSPSAARSGGSARLSLGADPAGLGSDANAASAALRTSAERWRA